MMMETFDEAAPDPKVSVAQMRAIAKRLRCDKPGCMCPLRDAADAVEDLARRDEEAQAPEPTGHCPELAKQRWTEKTMDAIYRLSGQEALADEVEKLQIGNSALLARIKGLEADAARLGWLAQQKWNMWGPNVTHGQTPLHGKLREAIDAAMKGGA